MKMTILIGLLLGLGLVGCSTTGVVTDFNPRANFASYQQYSWADNSGGDKTVSPFAIDAVQEAFKTQLAATLYKQAETSAKADFIARYYVAEGADTIDRSPRLGIGLGSFSGNFGMGTSVGVPLGKDTVVKNIMIIIDLINPADKKLTWRGSLVVELDPQNPKTNQAAINDAVAEIWAQFPPQ